MTTADLRALAAVLRNAISAEHAAAALQYEDARACDFPDRSRIAQIEMALEHALRNCDGVIEYLDAALSERALLVLDGLREAAE